MIEFLRTSTLSAAVFLVPIYHPPSSPSYTHHVALLDGCNVYSPLHSMLSILLDCHARVIGEGDVLCMLLILRHHQTIFLSAYVDLFRHLIDCFICSILRSAHGSLHRLNHTLSYMDEGHLNEAVFIIECHQMIWGVV